MKLIFEIPLLEQIHKAIHEAEKAGKKVAGVEVTQSESAQLTREVYGQCGRLYVNSTGLADSLYGVPIKVVG